VCDSPSWGSGEEENSKCFGTDSRHHLSGPQQFALEQQEKLVTLGKRVQTKRFFFWKGWDNDTFVSLQGTRVSVSKLPSKGESCPTLRPGLSDVS
jgi:hypothetical protein